MISFITKKKMNHKDGKLTCAVSIPVWNRLCACKELTAIAVRVKRLAPVG